jgi:hypothetical protein
MKAHLNVIWGMIGLATVTAASLLMAVDVTATYTLNATNSHAPPDYSRSASIAVSESNSVMVALNAQALLLKEMLQEHQGRAAELAQNNQPEKAKWENELVSELQEKSGRMQKSIEQLSQPGAGTKELKGAGGTVDDELIFISTIEARLEQIRQDLAAIVEDNRVLSLQISTNRAPDQIGAMSSTLGDNQRFVKELQREQFDLELRKLEFRAIRKATQK